MITWQNQVLQGSLTISPPSAGEGADAELQSANDRDPEGSAAGGEEPAAQDSAQWGEDSNDHVQKEPPH